MNNEFKIKKLNNETRFILENASAGSTSAAMVAAVETSLGVLQRRVDVRKKSSKRAYMENQDFNGEYDDEAGMAESNLHTLARAVQGLIDTIKKDDNLPEWCQEKIAKAELMLVSVWDYLLSQKEQGIDPKQSVAEDPINELSPDLLTRAAGAAAKKRDELARDPRLKLDVSRSLGRHYDEKRQKFAQGAQAAAQRDALAGVSRAAQRRAGVAEGTAPKPQRYDHESEFKAQIPKEYRDPEESPDGSTGTFYDQNNRVIGMFKRDDYRVVDGPGMGWYSGPKASQGVAEESDSDLSSSTKRDLIANFKQAWQGGAVSVERAIEDAMRPLLNVGVLKRSEIDAAEEFLYYVADMEQQPEEPYHDRDEDPMLGIYEGLRDPKDNPCWKGYKPVGTKKKGGRTVPNCVPVKEDDYTIDLFGKLEQVVNEKAPPGDKYERMVKHIKKGYAKDGKLTDVEMRKAYGAAWKAKNKSKNK